MFGWIVYGLVALLCISGAGDMFIRGRNPRGNMSSMVLFVWLVGIGCLVVFVVTDIHKLHMLWVMAVGGVVAMTPIGRIVGILVGRVLRVNVWDPSQLPEYHKSRQNKHS